MIKPNKNISALLDHDLSDGRNGKENTNHPEQSFDYNETPVKIQLLRVPF